MKRQHSIKAVLGACVGAIMCTLPMTAQETLKSGYFLKSNLYNHQLNPAMTPDAKGYVAIPVIGNINVGVQTNVGISSFLYPGQNETLNTFMSEEVDYAEFMNKLPKNVRIGLGSKIGIISLGFKGWNGFNTLELNLRTNGFVSTSSGFFDLMKGGLTKEDGIYNLKNTTVSAKAYAELALGHSRQINENFRVGAKLKFLVGAAQAYAKVRDLQVKIADDQWMVSGSGEMVVSAKSSFLKTNSEAGVQDKPGKEDEINFDHSFKTDDMKLGPSGFGGAIDLGVVYKLNEDFEFSGAITDLGFLNWSNSERAYTNGEPWTFKGFENIPYRSKDENGNEKPNNIDNQFDQIKDQLEEFYALRKHEGSSSYTQILAANINVSAKYTLPTYRKLSFGFLGTTRFISDGNMIEGRLFTNIEPNKWFSFSANGGLSTYGAVMGWMLNLHPGPVDLFVGTDYQFFKVTPKYYAPINKGGVNLALGLNIRW